MDLFDLVAKITLDTSEYEKGLADSEKKAGGFGDKIKTALGTAGAITVAGVTAAATGVAALTNQAVNSYGQYEQLVGGVETLFGDSADTVQQYADNAFKTAGLSANQYMETVTSFSASLLQSLGGDTEAAANYADTAITDMSDNANKMGTSMEAIQVAYQGFAKQNYTMLDNLKLGYGGTKTEMERLITDAEALNSNFRATRDENGKLTMSYADIVDAIHIVQTDIGITGTTAKEASETIEGSTSAMKSAWKNMVAGLANDNANLDKLIDDLVSSATTAAGNILPRISEALTGIGDMIVGLAPVINDALPTLISDVLPNLLSAATTLIIGFINTIIENTPLLIETAITAFVAVCDSLADALPQLIPLIIEAFITITKTIIEHTPEIIEAVLKILLSIGDMLVSYGKDFWNKVTDTCRTVINTIVDWLSGLPEKMAYWAGYAIGQFIKFFMELPGKVAEWLTNVINRVKQFGENLRQKAIEVARNFKEKLIEGVRELPQRFLEIGQNIIQGIWNGISAGWDWLVGKVRSLAQSLLQGAKDALGIASPSKAFAKLGLFSAEGFGVGFEKEFAKVKNDIEDDLDFSSTSSGVSFSGSVNGGRSSAFAGGSIVINVENMNVRNDNDIRQIAKQLFNMINQSSRSQGLGGVYA